MEQEDRSKKQEARSQEPEVRRYRFRALPEIEFYQEELDYDQDMAVRKILKTAALTVDENFSILHAVDQIAEQGLLPWLWETVLKVSPAERVRWWQVWKMSRTQRLKRAAQAAAKVSDISHRLKNSETAVLMRDFFHLNSSWLGEVMSSLLSSLSPEETKISGILSLLRNYFTRQPEEANPRPTGSES